MKRKERRKFAVFKKTTGGGHGGSQAKKAAPTTTKAAEVLQVRTHNDAAGSPFESFAAFLRHPMPDVRHSEADEAFLLADYCRQALAIMERVVSRLVRETGFVSGAPPSNLLSALESVALKQLRAQWDEQLRAFKYGLWHPPPLSGGTTTAYSLASQLWLLIAHANVILQQGGALVELGRFYPPASAYLSCNRLVLDTPHVVDYPLRTLVLTIENFVERLDTLRDGVGSDGDFVRFAAALEHCASTLACFQYDARTLNAAEWCVPSGTAGKLRVSERFILSCVVWFATLRDYADNYAALAGPQRMPVAEVQRQPWLLGGSSMRGLSAFLCRYSHDHMVDEVYRSALRDFLRQFQLRPSDMDYYRVTNGLNEAPITSVRTHRFEHTSDIAQAYLYHVHFERSVNEYVCEALQWREGELRHTRSASLGVQGLLSQLAVMFVWHQFLLSKFHFDFKAHCFMYHRDPSFEASVVKARIGTPFAIIVQQFGQFSLIVPPHGARHTQQRVYDCPNIFVALALWSVWTMLISDGKVERNVALKTFFFEVFGEQQLLARMETAR